MLKVKYVPLAEYPDEVARDVGRDEECGGRDGSEYGNRGACIDGLKCAWEIERVDNGETDSICIPEDLECTWT